MKRAIIVIGVTVMCLFGLVMVPGMMASGADASLYGDVKEFACQPAEDSPVSATADFNTSNDTVELSFESDQRFRVILVGQRDTEVLSYNDFRTLTNKDYASSGDNPTLKISPRRVNGDSDIVTRNVVGFVYWSDSSGVHCAELYPSGLKTESTLEPTSSQRFHATSTLLYVSNTSDDTRTVETRTALGNHSLKIVSTENAVNHQLVASSLQKYDEQLDVSCDNNINLFIAGDSGPGAGVLYRGYSDPENSNMWIQAPMSPETDDVYAHELVHAHQCYETTSEMEWFDEASAQFIGKKLYTNATASDEHPTMYGNKNRTFASVDLTNQSTWEDKPRAQYQRGGMIIAHLDYQLRVHDNGGVTMVDILRWANERDGFFTYDAFRNKIVNETDEDVGEWMDTQIQGSGEPLDDSLNERQRHALYGADKPIDPEFNVTTEDGEIIISVASWGDADSVTISQGDTEEVLNSDDDTAVFTGEGSVPIATYELMDGSSRSIIVYWG